jgi:hypothetical protein
MSPLERCQKTTGENKVSSQSLQTTETGFVSLNSRHDILYVHANLLTMTKDDCCRSSNGS